MGTGTTAVCGFIGLTFTLATPAMAQVAPGDAPVVTEPDGSNGSPGLNDIVVTAQKRSESLQNVPISVSALTSSALQTAVVRTPSDLVAIVPGLQIPSTIGSASPHLRGIGTQSPGPTNENAVALYVDGVYIASPVASLLSLSNVAQVEVLNGPQGTLFGRNATGGVISITTKTPTDHFTAEAKVGYANYNTVDGSVYLAGPIADGLKSDLSVQILHQGDGYGKNLANGKDVYKTSIDLNVRSKSVASLGDRTTAEFIVDYFRNRNSAMSALRSPAGEIPLLPLPSFGNNRYNVNSDSQPFARIEGEGASLKLTRDLDGATVTSTTAYRRLKFGLNVDYDAAPIDGLVFGNNSLNKEFTQEIQLSSSSSGRFKWTVGAFYFWNAGDVDQHIDLGGPFQAGTGLSHQLSVGNQTTRSLAGYAQATYEIFDGTNVTGGVRYSYEKRSLDGSFTLVAAGGGQTPIPVDQPSITFKKPTFRVAVDHRFSPSAMIYASFNRGFKSGGFNAQEPLDAPFLPEKLDAWEVGAKLDLFDRRVRINPSAFYYDYSNIQVTRYLPSGPSLYNGASAQLYGLDLQYQFEASRSLMFSGGMEYLHSKFTSFPDAVFSYQIPTGGYNQLEQDAKGNRLPQAPTFVGSVTATYNITTEHSGSFDIAGTYEYNSGYYTEPDNRLRQGDYSLISASVTWMSPDKRYSLQAWAKNLANEAIAAQLLTASHTVGLTLMPPRTFGITGGVKF